MLSAYMYTSSLVMNSDVYLKFLLLLIYVVSVVCKVCSINSPPPPQKK